MCSQIYSNKTIHNHENNLCAISYPAGLHKHGEERKNGNVNYGDGERAGPFTTAFEETDNLAAQEFEEKNTVDIEKRNPTDSNHYCSR